MKLAIQLRFASIGVLALAHQQHRIQFATHASGFSSRRSRHHFAAGEFSTGENRASVSILRSAIATAALDRAASEAQRWTSSGVVRTDTPTASALFRALRSSVAIFHPRFFAIAKAMASPSPRFNANSM